MPRPTGKRRFSARRRSFLRLAVVGAGLLVVASVLPLVWRATHTLKACMTVTESYLKGESLRDFAFHLNDVLAHDAAIAVQRPEKLDLENRELIASQLRDKLLIAKLARQACHAKCALDRADSLQGVLRAHETAAIELARTGRRAEALARLDDADHREAAHGFVAALDEYARDFKRDVNEALAAERAEEQAAMAWVALILVISVSLWFILLRSVERWQRRVLDEVRQREAARRELTASLRRYGELLDQVHEAMLLLECGSGRILEANPAASELLGLSTEELLASTIGDVEVGGGSTTLDASDGVVVEREFRHRDGTPLLVELSRRRVRDRGREAMLCLARDVTRRRELEARLARAQQMECVGRVAAGMAHDLGNTLLAISAQASRLRLAVRSETAEARAFACIEAALERATAVIGSLLSVADGSTANPREIDAAEVVRESLDFIEAVLPARIGLAVSLPRDTPLWIRADPERLDQALLNLVLNARDAMPEGGELELAVAPAPAAPDGPPAHAVISVADTGSGIAPAIRERIGEPFLSTKATGGIGLGLYNVKRVVEECGGRLEVESGAGEGTTVRAVLPLVAPPEIATASATTGSGVTGDRVLLVQDDDFARALMADALGAEGYRVRSLDTDEQLQRELGGEAVGLVIVDSEWRAGRGVECVAGIQRRVEPPPVMLVLGRPWREVEGRIEEGTPVLVKPYTVGALGRLARAAVARGRRGKEALA